MTDWSGVRARIEALRTAPESAKVFGARGHKFVLDDPLTPEHVAELEAWLHVELPAEYRTFLLTVGAGGAGPAYGVFTLRRTESGWWNWVGEGGDLTAVDLVVSPFPERADPEAMAALEADRPDEESFDDAGEFESAYVAWDDRVRDLLWSAERTAGAICLCHLGCGMRLWLVVTGPERGRIWDDSRCEDFDLTPMVDALGEPVTFGSWYLDWLRETEAACGLGGAVPAPTPV